MAKGFIDAPQEGDCVQWSESLGPSCQNTQVTQTGQENIASHTPVTPDEEHTDDGTISSASSQENLPPLSATLQSSTSPSPFSPMPSHPPPPSPSFPSASSPTPSQLNPSSPSLPSSSHLPPLPNQLTEPSSPPPVHTAHTPMLSSPYSPAQSGPHEQASSISVEELQELAIQDSANNNVDENSNDQQYDRYANYHQEYSQMQFVPDQSVRPRVRRGAGVPREEQEADCAPATRPDIGQRGSSEGEGSRYSHRRNLSEGLPSTSLGYRRDSTHEHPPLPNFNASSGCACPLPRVPNLHPSSTGEHHERENWIEEHGRWTSSPGRWLPLSLRGGRYGSPPPPEDTTRGAQELLFNFTTDVLHSHSLQVPQDVRAQGSFSNPTWSRAARELRMLADAFAETEERRRVRCMAETVNMHSMTMENFFQLCAELFSDGITRERIVALFTFVGDVAVYQVRLRGEQFLQILLNWSLKYLVDHVCRWVEDAGGWAVVLGQGANILYQTAVLAFCVCGSLAAGLYIYKTLKDW